MTGLGLGGSVWEKEIKFDIPPACERTRKNKQKLLASGKGHFQGSVRIPT